MSLRRTARLLIQSLMGLSLWLTAAAGEGLPELCAVATGSFDASATCPTRFDFEVLASAADSGKLIDLSAYRFRGETCYSPERYSPERLGGFQRVADRSRAIACQGGAVAGMSASAAPRRSSQIT